MLGRIWRLLRDSVEVFIAADALSRGASISFYTVTSIGPVLFIVVAIASQLGGLMRRESAEMVQTVLKKRVGQVVWHSCLRRGCDHPAHHRLWRVRIRCKDAALASGLSSCILVCWLPVAADTPGRQRWQ
jgi:hypothetical protein